MTDVGKRFTKLVMGSRVELVADLCKDCLLEFEFWFSRQEREPSYEPMSTAEGKSLLMGKREEK